MLFCSGVKEKIPTVTDGQNWVINSFPSAIRAIALISELSLLSIFNLNSLSTHRYLERTNLVCYSFSLGHEDYVIEDIGS